MKSGKSKEANMKKWVSLTLLAVGLAALVIGALLKHAGALAGGLVLCVCAALVFVPDRDCWDQWSR